MADEDDRDLRTTRGTSPGGRRIFLTTWALLTLMVTCLALGTPPSAGPDEPAHLARSAALVRGDVFGSASSLGPAYRSVSVPPWAVGPEPCYASRPQQSAACLVDREPGPVVTSAASYPVWGHLLPGLGTLVGGESGAIRAARILGALPSTLLLAAALTVALAGGRRRLAVAILLAATPMTLFLISVVNPSGLVIAGAIAVWTAVLVGPVDAAPNRALFLAGAAALVLPRGDGLMWAGLICLLILFVEWQTPRAFLGRFRPGERVALGLIGVTAASWTLLVRPELIGTPIEQTGIARAQAVLAGTGSYLREAVGVLGWLDTPIPEPALFLWVLVVGVLAGSARIRGRRVLVGTALAVFGFFAVGWALEYAQAASAGLYWQGRYGLPILVGAVLLVSDSDGDDRQSERVVPIAALSVWFIWNASVFQVLRRFGIGADGSVLPWKWVGEASALPPLLLIAAHGAASAALCGLVAMPAVTARGRSTSDAA